LIYPIFFIYFHLQKNLLRIRFTMAPQTTQTRFNANIKINPELMSKLIGFRGSNIRRIVTAVRDGCYIRGNGDTFNIQAYTQEAVKKAAKMLLEDQQALSNPDTHRSKPVGQFIAHPACIGHLVGRSGSGLKTIMKQIGDGCYIVHKEGAFHVTANTSDDVDRAISILRQQNKDCWAWQERQKLDKEQQSEPQPIRSTLGKNSFAAIATDDTDSEEEEQPSVPIKKRYKRGTRVGALFPAGKVEELKNQRATAYKMRALLAEMRNCPVDEIDWQDVDAEIERMKPTENVPKRVDERPDTTSLEDFPQENVLLKVSEKPKWGNGKGRESVMSGNGETYYVPAITPPPPTPKKTSSPTFSGPVPHQVVQVSLDDLF